ncbi:hypothetical protein B0H66DRAFT_537882 [Apodospora peruviana]|uniref:SET domain-containing protein n=1 Tax=Apodospora peruviana TaxID=516989 RepID=A0AAE0LYX4_9PEZI|nr:hypothetical protein B0H66DRAFT_537882 [Apodospora peruviana]
MARSINMMSDPMETRYHLLEDKAGHFKGVDRGTRRPIPQVWKVTEYVYEPEDWNPKHSLRDWPSLHLPLPQHAWQVLHPGRIPVSHRDYPRYRCLYCHKPAGDNSCRLDCYFHFKCEILKPVENLLEIRMTPNMGWGMFLKANAERELQKGDWLGQYLGRLLPGNANDNRSDYLMPMAETDTQNGKLFIDAAECGNWTRFVNSRCNPNVDIFEEQAGQVTMVVLRARKTIKRGGQLFINYGPNYFNGVGNKICLCPDQKGKPHGHKARTTNPVDHDDIDEGSQFDNDDTMDVDSPSKPRKKKSSAEKKKNDNGKRGHETDADEDNEDKHVKKRPRRSVLPTPSPSPPPSGLRRSSRPRRPRRNSDMDMS